MKVNVGDKFGRWTVLKVGVKNPNSKAKKPTNMSYCRCDCGNEKYISYQNLYSGTSKSCGCLKAEQLAEKNHNKTSVKIGNIYGKLIVKEDLGYRIQSRGKQERWYKCLCTNCGNDNFEVSGNNLQSGGTQSCGCVNSRGETAIAQYLRRKDINYVTQYTFPDLISLSGHKLRFDFAILDDNNQIKYLIEFDGRQHTFGPDGTWTQASSLEEIKYNDKLKNEYCKQHNLSLLRINYTDIGNIDMIIEKYEK